MYMYFLSPTFYSPSDNYFFTKASITFMNPCQRKQQNFYSYFSEVLFFFLLFFGNNFFWLIMHQVFSRENSFVIEVTFWGFSISETRRKAFDSLGGKLTLNLQLMKLNQECHGLGKRHKQKKTCSRPTYFLVIDVSLSQRWQCIAERGNKTDGSALQKES